MIIIMMTDVDVKTELPRPLEAHAHPPQELLTSTTQVNFSISRSCQNHISTVCDVCYRLDSALTGSHSRNNSLHQCESLTVVVCTRKEMMDALPLSFLRVRSKCLTFTFNSKPLRVRSQCNAWCALLHRHI